MRGWICLLLLMGFLAACTPVAEDVPTLIPVTQATPVLDDPTTVPEHTSVAERATLPATATHTPTITPTFTQTQTATVTVTPSQTITDTPSPTFTPLPTIAPDDRPIISFALTAAAFTPLPGDFVVSTFEGINATGTPFIGNNPVPTPVPGSIGVPPTLPPPPVVASPAATCPFFPPGNFGTLYTANPDLAIQLGCTAESPPNVLTQQAAIQDFENGIMLWLNGDIYVLDTTTDSYQYFTDTFASATDPETSSETPPAGRFAPVRGFLKVWANNPSVRNSLGWALTTEQGTQASVLRFANGLMISPANRTNTLVLIGNTQGNGTWRAVQ